MLCWLASKVFKQRSFSGRNFSTWVVQRDGAPHVRHQSPYDGFDLEGGVGDVAMDGSCRQLHELVHFPNCSFKIKTSGELIVQLYFAKISFAANTIQGGLSMKNGLKFKKLRILAALWQMFMVDLQLCSIV